MLETAKDIVDFLAKLNELLLATAKPEELSLHTIVACAISIIRFPICHSWIYQVINSYWKRSGGNIVGKLSVDNHENLLKLKCLRILVAKRYLVDVNRSLLETDYLLTIFPQIRDQRLKYQMNKLLIEHYELSRNEMKDCFEFISEAIEFDLYLDAFLSGVQVFGGGFDFQLYSGLVSNIFHTVVNSSIINEKEMSDQTENLLIPRNSSRGKEKGDFIATPTTKENLIQFYQALATGKPIVLKGEEGSGKSTIIRQAAVETKNDEHLVVLHVNEQTDVKSLIGTYVCSDIPGEFLWKNGIITSSVVNGYWVVIEDIDKVSNEIISMLSLLLESRLFIHPQFSQPLQAHHNFRLIGTITSSRKQHYFSSSMDSSAALVMEGISPESVAFPSISLPKFRNFADVFQMVQIHSLSQDDIFQIVARKAPNVPQSLQQSLITGMITYCQSKQQHLKVHELFKLLKRLNVYFTVSGITNDYISDQLKRQIALDISDLICGKIRHPTKTIEEMKILSAFFGIFPSEIEYLTLHYIPVVEAKHSRKDLQGSELIRTIAVGRAAITTVTSDSLAHHSAEHFAKTNFTKKFLEKLAVCIQNKEPVLLVGETGGGKTTTVQELARMLGKELLVQNLSLSTDLNDLLGGYRPTNIRNLFLPLYEHFIRLFRQTLSSSKNDEFLRICNESFQQGKWSKLVKACLKASQSAIQKMDQELPSSNGELLRESLREWKELQASVKRFESSLNRIENGMVFAFQRGLLFEAMEKGHWILLDEINLAGSETLQILSSILDFNNDKIFSDFGDSSHGITIHPEFFLFAAMNPPTDICKKELPETLRNRFTEFYVEEIIDPRDLKAIVERYLTGISEAPIADIVSVYLACRSAAESSLEDGSGQRPRFSLRSLTRSLKSSRNFLAMGLRPFRRCLFEGFLVNFQSMLNEKGQVFMEEYLRQSLFPVTMNEGSSKDLNHPPARPGGKSSRPTDWALIKPFWLKTGTEPQVDWAATDGNNLPTFIQTKSVTKYVRTIAAAIAANVGAVLLQGPTSTGKTTMIQYLAAKTGHKCLRINNHEHTDIQEYIGSYITAADGSLTFQDGLLVQALRNGYWIILDELNLAPSDILEALNRLLDDNRELLIPETGEIVKPAEGFFLFATQNPPGVYGGRKPLSLAFRNRFVEVNIVDLPTKEIEEIITKSCRIAPKFSTMLVRVMLEIQRRRQASTLLMGKEGTVTVRDLIKWARRDPSSALEVVKHGYMVIAEKFRSREEKRAVLDILMEVCRIKWDSEEVYQAPAELTTAHTLVRNQQLKIHGVSGFALTPSLIRMWNLLWFALQNSEPVLLIGEAGCGKTMVVQLIAAFQQKSLRILNCHQSTETSDLVGSFRPVRGREAAQRRIEEVIIRIKTLLSQEDMTVSDLSIAALDRFTSEVKQIINAKSDPIGKEVIEEVFTLLEELDLLKMKLFSIFEWQNGPVVEAMIRGEILLIDEINLAEDAVIERINSVLEFKREITLAEKGGEKEMDKIVAHPDFRLVATMNPAGDFGKRELSPALRSRFTEIWIPAVVEVAEMKMIVVELLSFSAEVNQQYDQEEEKGLGSPQLSLSVRLAESVLQFIEWMNRRMQEEFAGKLVITIREIIAWVTFIVEFHPNSVYQVYLAMLHGAFLTILDGLGLGSSISRELLHRVKAEGLSFLLHLSPSQYGSQISRLVRISIVSS